MKMCLILFVTFVYSNLVSSAPLRHLYADSPDTRYLTTDQTYSANRNPPSDIRIEYSEYKHQPNYHAMKIQAHEATETRQQQKPNAPPKKPDTPQPQTDKSHEDEIHNKLKKSNNEHNDMYLHDKIGHKIYMEKGLHEKHNYFTKLKANACDRKGSVAQINARKSAQKMILNENQQNALSGREEYIKIRPNMVLDKTLQKVTSHRNLQAQMMSVILDNIANEVLDKRVNNNVNNNGNKMDNRNGRHQNSSRNVLSDIVAKHINKNINSTSEHMMRGPPRTGSLHEELVNKNAPYTLFYKTPPKNLERLYSLPQVFMEKHVIHLPDKEKRLSINYRSDSDLRKGKLTKNYSSVRLSKAHS